MNCAAKFLNGHPGAKLRVGNLSRITLDDVLLRRPARADVDVGTLDSSDKAKLLGLAIAPRDFLEVIQEPDAIPHTKRSVDVLFCRLAHDSLA